MTQVTPVCTPLSYFCNDFGPNLRIAHRNRAVRICLEMVTFRKVIAMRLLFSSKECIHTLFVVITACERACECVFSPFKLRNK